MARALISAEDVRAARRRRETRLSVPAGAIVTPLARDEASRWGIELVGEAGATRESAPSDVERVVQRVLAQVPEADPEQVRTIARRLLGRLDR
ncbi:MAG: hypothetical protein R3199_00695 [Gemmatimonadota bacterium]|nr:hypothetical protein [Gemmatimonadota bacterium]